MLTAHQQKLIDIIADYKKKHPQATMTQAFKDTKVPISTYASARAKLNKSKPGRKRGPKPQSTMHTIPVENDTTALVAFVGNPKQVVASIKELLA